MITIAGAVVAGAAATAAAAVLALAPSSHDDRSEGSTRTVAVASEPPAAPVQQECAVCLSVLAGAAGCSGSAAAVRTLPRCGHGFHAECIGRWVPLRAECPLCRCPVLAEAGADGQPAATTAVVPAPPAWSRPARIVCGFGEGRVVWTRSPPAPATVTDGVTYAG